MFVGQGESRQWQCGQEWGDDQHSGTENGDFNRFCSSRGSRQTAADWGRSSSGWGWVGAMLHSRPGRRRVSQCQSAP